MRNKSLPCYLPEKWGVMQSAQSSCVLSLKRISMTFTFSKMSPDARGRFVLIIMESRMVAASETLLFISLATACKSRGEFWVILIFGFTQILCRQ